MTITMLVSARTFRRRSRLLVLVLIGIAVFLVHRYQAAFDVVNVHLPGQALSREWWPHAGAGTQGGLLADVSNATLGFQQIFVVSLPTRTDRSDAMVLAASLTGLQLTFSAGVDGQAVQDRVLPADSAGQPIPTGNKGSWRAHMNVLRQIIERNLTTALIMEDDIDWDARLKTQMGLFARATQVYGQPERGSGKTTLARRHTPPFGKAKNEKREDLRQQNKMLRKGQQAPSPQVHQHVATADAEKYTQKQHDVALTEAPAFVPATMSPYGDDWDVLWLGHCGTEFPASPPSPAKRPDSAAPADGKEGGPMSAPAQLSLLRVTMSDDTTVPRPADLRPHPYALPDRLGELYPPQTRVVHAASGTLCTQAYAVSQRGARKLLYQFGLASFTTGFDLMLRDWCDGMYRQGPGTTPRRKREAVNNGRKEHGSDKSKGQEEPLPQCLTVQPPLFSHYLTAKESNSDIAAQGGGFLHKTGSQYVRLSVQQNLRRLVNGAGVQGLKDQWPSEVVKPADGA
ncbi:hypothetical protein SBRCBS47491_007578 [Sporothrix bragantina]|uniref:Glycosyl transferase family 25 domain-containing protein n=1 Tax=Sporothrix bragantina TaxID=671064 RepID=A0ABP0CH23_9PEZI